MPQTPFQTKPHARRAAPWLHGPVWLIVGIVLIAANLRAPVTAVAPLLGTIQAYFGLDAAAAGALTALPLLVFALVSPLAPWLARQWGLERALGAALCLMLAGIVLRSTGLLGALFGGTLLIGVGIALGNVLLPGVLKRDFPERIASLTSLYALTMGVTAAAVSALAIPLAQGLGLGWRGSMLASGVVVLIALSVWLPQLRKAVPSRVAQAATPATQGVWRSPLAWQVTLFLGLNSLVYYIVISWLPAMLADAGYTAARAGNLHGLLQLASALPGFVLVPLLRRGVDQRGLAVATSMAALCGVLGLWLAPQWALLWSLLFGFGGGAVLILALAFVGLRVATVAQAAALSGMAQCIGYLLAASGPAVMGKLHDAAGDWSWVLFSCAIACVLMAIAGYLAGRPLKIA